MNVNVKRFYAALSMLGLLASCAQLGALEAQNADTRSATQNTRTYADHDNLAKHYENTAKEMQVKAEEQKKLLQQYEDKSYFYGTNGQTFQAHTSANIRSYERALRENLDKAAFHREMAAELAKREYATPAETPSQRNNRENKAKAVPTESVESPGKAL
ncbi:MAG: hypothetical protein AAB359_02525 [Elusimicrobiota bacterium]